jgi:excisionase family DNA binding protein
MREGVNVIRKAEILYPAKEKAKPASPYFPGEDRLLTIKEVSALTGLAVGTLYHFVSQKRIPVMRLSKRCIRFRLSSLKRWFEDLGERDC